MECYTCHGFVSTQEPQAQRSQIIHAGIQVNLPHLHGGRQYLCYTRQSTNVFCAWEGDTIFQGCFLYTRPRKDSQEQKLSEPLCSQDMQNHERPLEDYLTTWCTSIKSLSLKLCGILARSYMGMIRMRENDFNVRNNEWVSFSRSQCFPYLKGLPTWEGEENETQMANLTVFFIAQIKVCGREKNHIKE